MADTVPLALEWGLFDLAHKMASSMSSEDHTAVLSLLKSIVTLLRNGVFEGVFEETTQQQRDESQESIIQRCHGRITSRWILLVHVRYYLMYLHAVSPTEGTVFGDVDTLVPTISKYFAGESVTSIVDAIPPATPAPAPAPPQATAPVVEKECVLCKFKVSGEMCWSYESGTWPPITEQIRFPLQATFIQESHRSQPNHRSPRSRFSRRPLHIRQASTGPYLLYFRVSESTLVAAFYSEGDNFFGKPGNPRSPVLREIEAVRVWFSCTARYYYWLLNVSWEWLCSRR
jgi:hypothetical protein